MEIVTKILQPGQKFCVEELHNAMTTVDKWRRNATLEKRSHILENFLDLINLAY
uniref:Uncharacterized protein n=1 Tax=Nelumbo nucifera TaxID=4432 RepID=A0A822YPX1_NELNU|nr:TPA_asm: hypothetical protein HUJ06_012240 [Nelumbo nucifera]